MENLRALGFLIQSLQKDANRDKNHEKSKEHNRRLKKLLTIACTVGSGAKDDGSIEERADKQINEMVSFAYGDDMDIPFLESFAHGQNGVVRDPALNEPLPKTVMKTLSKMFAQLGDPGDSYYHTKRPYDNTSLLARFRDEIPPPDLSDATPASRAVFQARAEITSAPRHTPIQLSLPINSPHLAFLQTCGNNDKSPLLSLFYCDVEAEYFCKEVTVQPGLVGVATHIASDAKRKLVWIADDDRIKSFSTVDGAELLRKHTLRSKNSGPIALVENGSRILRAGRAGIETWNVDSLCTHGSTGKRRIGPGKLELPEFTWHDECDMEDLEFSTGQAPDSTVTSIAHEPRIWSPFHDTQSMLVAPVGSYSCLSVDLVAGYTVTNRYLGHGGTIHEFSTSPADANSFLTACSDGIVRLFDIRENLPRLSIDVGGGTESISSALYVHVDGLPIVITGGRKSESIKVWDPRARSIVYELATGNNRVVSMVWDAPRSTLFAATQCPWMDKFGYHHEYRPAKIPKRFNPPRAPNSSAPTSNRAPSGASISVEDAEEDSDEGWDDEEESSDDDRRRYWPQHAYHTEKEFGYAFDAGDHCLFRYKFGIDADPSIVPEYGDAAPFEQEWDSPFGF